MNRPAMCYLDAGEITAILQQRDQSQRITLAEHKPPRGEGKQAYRFGRQWADSGFPAFSQRAPRGQVTRTGLVRVDRVTDANPRNFPHPGVVSLHQIAVCEGSVRGLGAKTRSERRIWNWRNGWDFSLSSKR
jgi:hypothetical protein